MGLKKYIISSIILIIVVFGYVHSLELGDYEITFLGYSQVLPVSVWFIVPIALLSLATYLHLAFYSIIAYFKQRAINKDHEEMIELVKSQLLEKNGDYKFRTKDFRNLSSILSQLKFSLKEERFSSSNEDLTKIALGVQDIKNGKFVADKSLKISDKTPLFEVNLLNKINEQIDFAMDVVKKSDSYSQNLVKAAFEKILKEKSMTTIKKIYKNVVLDKDLANKLFEKDAANNEFGFTSEEILKIVKDLDYKKEDFISLAKTYEKILKPDQLIAIFEKLSVEIDEATSAYLHVLCEYEMIDKVKEVVANTKDSEFTAFKALLDLKDAGKKYNIEAISYK